MAEPQHPGTKQGIYLYQDIEVATTASPVSGSGQNASTSSRGHASNDPVTGLRTNFMTTLHQQQSVDHDEVDKLNNPLSPANDQGPFGGPKELLAHLPQDFGPAAPPSHAISIIVGIGVGVGLGLLFYYLKIGPKYQQLVMLPGDLFVRALRCLMVPLVFCMLTIVVAETVARGHTSILRWRTLVPYVLSTVLATVQGMLLAIVFQSSFTLSSAAALAHPSTNITPVNTLFNLTLQCANGLYVAASTDNGTLACADATPTAFLAMNRSLVVGVPLPTKGKATLVDALVAIANVIVPDNIFAALSTSALLSIVMFTIPLGAAVAVSASDGQDNVVLHVLRQLRNVFMSMLNGLLWVTPVAIAFLLAGAACNIDAQSAPTVLSQVAVLVLAVLIGAVLHTAVVLPLVLYAWTKTNPFAFLRHIIPAYIFAFGCASSMAAMPMVITCIERANISRSLAHITMSFGTPLNMNAAGIYYPLAVVFLANMSGNPLATMEWVVVFFVSILGSVGTAPVPNAALVYMITLWQTVFPAEPLPVSFAWIVAADFLFDRIRTVVNVNGNAVVTRILADDIDETFEARAQQHV
ncbi:hypothetical protein H257_11612 [Aphanomyces astaci]|uniref:Amino acid transporter n=1 Tax=Aphanomyces astaci TaxID=112090 RepID=W4G349_APHAT|nr:hypothetical protein H257_11612 [Aphanomyces astaci]ETV73484.1 hypothetical protein H257_11612 [Aphanomyces astaci]RQM26792.1 hypothetical protein B5M09_004660 [Aphanomyces astaci]|eukprot:XP_009836910.1 hypothetical protein H257_11612 [Aphanomyces astaci]